METALRHESSQNNGTRSSSDGSEADALSHMKRDINDLVSALALLGIGRCSQCRQFFQRSDPGALFDYGQLVCYECILDWWASVSSQLSVNDREKVEAKLAPWLRKYHRAEVVRDTPGTADTKEVELQIVTTCFECRGTGKLLEGERCRFCNGLRTVRLVVPR